MSGKDFRDLRVSTGLSQRALARIMSIKSCTVCNWEAGRSRVDPKAIAIVNAISESRK